MNLPQLPARIASFRRAQTVLALLLLPISGWSEMPPPTPTEQLAEARATKDDASVVELCRRQLESSPGEVGTLREMFRAQLDLGDDARAAETLARLGKTTAPAALVAELRGDLALAADKTDDALAAWREALTARPGDAPAILGKIADALDAAGRWPEAAEALRAFLATKPDHAARTARLAVCLLNTGRPEDADKQALAAGRIDASDETVKATMPIFDRLRPQLSALRKLADRIAAFKRGTDGTPDPRLDRALIYYRVGAYAAALADARRVTEDTGERSVAARLLRGECLWKLDRDQEAVGLRVAKIEDARWFDDPRRCDRLRAPDELGTEDTAAVVRACAARAMVLLAGNQPVLALEDAERATHAEEKAGRRTGDTEVVLAAALLRNDRPTEALAAARCATKNDPKNPDGWALCGRLSQEAADFPAAVDNLSRALAIREEAAWLRRRETCLRVLGRNPEADRDARRAAQLPTSS